VVFEEHLSAEHYKLNHTDKRPVSLEAPQLTLYSYERPLYGSLPDSVATTDASTAGAAVVPAASAGYVNLEQKPPTNTVQAGVSTVGAVVPPASSPTAPSAAAAGSTFQALGGTSTDAQPEETRLSESLASEKPKKTSGKRLKNFLLGSRSKSNSSVTTPVAAVQSLSTDTVERGHSADARYAEHKSAEPTGERSPHHTQHRPTPLVIPLLPQSLSGSTSRPASTTHQGHPSGGIADLSYDSDSVQTKSTAPSAAPGTARSGATTPASAAAAPESGLGMGHNLGLSVSVPAPHRNSVSSVDSELSGGAHTGTANTPSATTTTDKTKKAKTPMSALKGIFKPRPVTPSNGNQAGIAEVPTPGSIPGAVPAATSPTAAQIALDGEETPVACSAPLEPSRPPSNRHSLRAFFTRENSNASHASVGSSVPGSTSQSLSASVEASESRAAPVVVNTQPPTPVAVVKRKKSFDSVVSWSTAGSVAPTAVPAAAAATTSQAATAPTSVSANAAAPAAAPAVSTATTVVPPAPSAQTAVSTATPAPAPAVPAAAAVTIGKSASAPITAAAPTAAPAGPAVPPRPVVKKIKKSMKPASMAGEYVFEAAMWLLSSACL
jgi:hypothetical protein